MGSYYSTPKEKEDMIKGIKEFSFTPLEEMNDSLFILISGQQGSGKTHLACSISDTMPVYLLGTELREKMVVKKFTKSKFPIYYKPVLNYQDIVVAMKAITKRFKDQRGAIVIDSGSDLQQFAEAQYKEWAKIEKVWPQYLWSKIWDMCDSIIYDIRKSGFMLIMTSRMKEEFLNDKSTGNMIPRIYNRVPYNADVCIELAPFSKERPVVITKPLEIYTGEVKVQRDMTLSRLIKELKL